MLLKTEASSSHTRVGTGAGAGMMGRAFDEKAALEPRRAEADCEKRSASGNVNGPKDLTGRKSVRTAKENADGSSLSRETTIFSSSSAESGDVWSPREPLPVDITVAQVSPFVPSPTKNKDLSAHGDRQSTPVKKRVNANKSRNKRYRTDRVSGEEDRAHSEELTQRTMELTEEDRAAGRSLGVGTFIVCPLHSYVFEAGSGACVWDSSFQQPPITRGLKTAKVWVFLHRVFVQIPQASEAIVQPRVASVMTQKDADEIQMQLVQRVLGRGTLF